MMEAMRNLSPKYIWLHIGIVTVVAVLVSTVAVFLYAATLPSAKSLPDFANYDACASGGGTLTSFNNLSACIGANDKLFMQYSAQNLPRINERKTTSVPNHVVANGTYSADLVSFLRQDYSGCNPTGYYEVIKEVKNRFALMHYGCDNDPQKGSATMIAIKLGDGWATLSPTDNMREDGTPSCLLVDMFKVSKQISNVCYETTGYNDGSTRDVTYQ